MEFERYGKREFQLARSYTPGPGYYGITRNPAYSDSYKHSFIDLFREGKSATDQISAKIKGYKFRPLRTTGNLYAGTTGFNAENAVGSKNHLTSQKVNALSLQEATKITPGPGEYFEKKCIDKLYLKRKENHLEKEARLRHKLKENKNISKTPTIPGNLQHWGYVKHDDQFYVIEMEQKDQNSLGPGIYDPKFTQTNPRVKGGFMPKGKSITEQLMEDLPGISKKGSQGLNQYKTQVGPGSYEHDLKYNSTLLRRQVMRQQREVEAQIHNEKIADVQMRKRIIDEVEAKESLKKIEDQESRSRAPKKKFHLTQKPFNSTDMTRDAFQIDQKNEKIGPGQYYLINKTILKEAFDKEKIKKLKEEKYQYDIYSRELAKKEPENVPGPGTYDQNFGTIAKKAVKGKGMGQSKTLHTQESQIMGRQHGYTDDTFAKLTFSRKGSLSASQGPRNLARKIQNKKNFPSSFGTSARRFIGIQKS